MQSREGGWRNGVMPGDLYRGKVGKFWDCCILGDREDHGVVTYRVGRWVDGVTPEDLHTGKEDLGPAACWEDVGMA